MRLAVEDRLRYEREKRMMATNASNSSSVNKKPTNDSRRSSSESVHSSHSLGRNYPSAFSPFDSSANIMLPSPCQHPYMLPMRVMTSPSRPDHFQFMPQQMSWMYGYPAPYPAPLYFPNRSPGRVMSAFMPLNHALHPRAMSSCSTSSSASSPTCIADVHNDSKT
jgi:hypothetical protein